MEKRYLLITAPITNGGDYLIERAMEKLLEERKIEFDLIRADEVKGCNIDKSYKAIITGGGPKFSDRLFIEDNLGINSIIDSCSIPIHYLGSGVYGDSPLCRYVYNYKFDSKTIDYMNKISTKAGSFGCRDVISYRILKNNGCKNVFYTGCPVWYLNKEESKRIEKRKIVISDPGVTKKKEEQVVRAEQAIKVIHFIRDKFPDDEIIFTFNNGIETKYSFVCNNLIRNYLNENHIKYYNLEKNSSLFSVYDDARLHIGFRVHSHLYCLGKKVPSILIEEDLRGYGMNESLGLRHVYSYDIEKAANGEYEVNQYLFDQLETELDIIKFEKDTIIKTAVEHMKTCYKFGLDRWFKFVLGKTDN